MLQQQQYAGAVPCHTPALPQHGIAPAVEQFLPLVRKLVANLLGDCDSIGIGVKQVGEVVQVNFCKRQGVFLPGECEKISDFMLRPFSETLKRQYLESPLGHARVQQMTQGYGYTPERARQTLSEQVRLVRVRANRHPKVDAGFQEYIWNVEFY